MELLGETKVRKVDFDAVKHLKGPMAKERVTLPENTEYFGLMKGDTLLGIVGVAPLKGTVRFRGDYVLPQYRGDGVFDTLMKWRMDYTARSFKRPIVVTAFCTPLSLSTYLRYGFRIERLQPTGITFVRRVIA